MGDTIVAGTAYGRVRAMVNDRGERVKEAGPPMPVEVIGFNDVPERGRHHHAVDDDSSPARWLRSARTSCKARH